MYPRESELINIIREVIQETRNLIEVYQRVNERMGEHPFVCAPSIALMLTEGGGVEFSYYLTSTDERYPDISGVMSL